MIDMSKIADYQPTPPNVGKQIDVLLDISDTTVQRHLIGTCLLLMKWGSEGDLFRHNAPNGGDPTRVDMPAELFKELLCIQGLAEKGILRAAKIAAQKSAKPKRRRHAKS